MLSVTFHLLKVGKEESFHQSVIHTGWHLWGSGTFGDVAWRFANRRGHARIRTNQRDGSQTDRNRRRNAAFNLELLTSAALKHPGMLRIWFHNKESKLGRQRGLQLCCNRGGERRFELSNVQKCQFLLIKQYYSVAVCITFELCHKPEIIFIRFFCEKKTHNSTYNCFTFFSFRNKNLKSAACIFCLTKSLLCKTVVTKVFNSWAKKQAPH